MTDEYDISKCWLCHKDVSIYPETFNVVRDTENDELYSICGDCTDKYNKIVNQKLIPMKADV